jgi:hypothetical protein
MCSSYNISAGTAMLIAAGSAPAHRDAVMSATGNLLRVVAVVWMCLAIVSCSPGPRDRVVNVKKADVIAGALQRCPLWTQTSEHDIKQRQQITDRYLVVAQYDTAVIRDGIALYLNSYPALSPQRFDAGDKIFALLRVVYKVPRRVEVRRERLPFSLRGNPVQADGVDLLWPFSIGNDGRLLLTGLDPGFHSGPAYEPLSDFDQMAVRLERRFPARQ